MTANLQNVLAIYMANAKPSTSSSSAGCESGCESSYVFDDGRTANCNATKLATMATVSNTVSSMAGSIRRTGTFKHQNRMYFDSILLRHYLHQDVLSDSIELAKYFQFDSFHFSINKCKTN